MPGEINDTTVKEDGIPKLRPTLLISTTTLNESLYNPSTDELTFLRATLGLDGEQIRTHILEIQKEAFQEYPYPCIHLFTFIKLYMASRPAYEEVLRAGIEKGDTTFLDVGCNMGTDVRKLAFDGYPVENIFACDLLGRFIDLGHKLYLDKDTCKINFFTADIFSFAIHAGSNLSGDYASSPLEHFRDRVTHLYSGLFFHLFDEQAQEGIAKRLAILLKRKPGSIIFGAHTGSAIAGELTTAFSKLPWAHSIETFSSLWLKVFADLEGETFVRDHLQINVVLRPESSLYKGVGDALYLDWSVKVV